jgi:hypothetical protein
MPGEGGRRRGRGQVSGGAVCASVRGDVAGVRVCVSAFGLCLVMQENTCACAARVRRCVRARSSSAAAALREQR